MIVDTLARRLIVEKASLPEKAVTGPGAAVMSWGIPISDASRSAHQMMRDAQTVYARGNRWVRRAEMTISGRVGSVKWHLEVDGETINDESPEHLRMIRDLLEKPLGDEEVARTYPGQPRTRRESWGLTSRHMGLCNVGFWYLDEIDRALGWPKRIFFIRPDRMTPREKAGRLEGWTLDADDRGGGTSLSLEEVLPFYLDPPDRGHFGSGLVESVLSTTSMPSAIDHHATDTLNAGGRLPGIYSPKETGTGDDVFERMVSDLRTIKEMPDSSKRDVVARAPIQFTPTSADMAHLNVIELSKMSRDDVLNHWGVPLSTIGGYTPAGMNSGETRKYDEAALWQNAIQFRIDALYETVQFRLLDRLGLDIQLVIDVPEFDDDAPKYALAEKAQALPLRNVERRAILGLDPFGDPALDNAVWMPVSVVSLATAPAEAGMQDVTAAEKEETPALSARDAEAVGVLIRAGFNPKDALRQLGLPIISHTGLLPVTLQPEKARLDKLLQTVRDHSAKRIQRELTKVLVEMRRDIAGRVREKGVQISRKPSDYQAWMPKSKQDEWAKRLTEVLNPHLSLAADTAAGRVQTQLGKTEKADFLSERVLSRLMKGVGLRIKGILDTTRDEVRALIEKGIKDGVSPAELADRIEEASTFSELRAETIARTETGTVLNQAAVESYREFGVEKVRIIDGDEDDVCASANGQEWTLEEFAADPLGHPNCVRDAVPIVGGA